MSVWDKIGEAIGSLKSAAGALAQAVDVDSWRQAGRDGAFTMALIALSAKMAKADGIVTPDERAAFFDIIHVPESSVASVERLFDLAQRDVAGFDAYARRIARLFEDTPDTLEHVLDGLFHIAKADGVVHENELGFLQAVAEIFGFSGTRFRQIMARHVRAEGDDPYVVLGIGPEASDGEVKAHYRALVKEHHPDRLMAKGVPQDLVEVMTDKIARINSAYDVIAKERGLR